MLNQISVPCLDSHHHNAKQMFEFRLGWQFLVEILACRFQALGKCHLVAIAGSTPSGFGEATKTAKTVQIRAMRQVHAHGFTQANTLNKVQENHETFAIVCLVPKRLEESSSSAPGS